MASSIFYDNIINIISLEPTLDGSQLRLKEHGDDAAALREISSSFLSTLFR